MQIEDRLEELLARATPGPWNSFVPSDGTGAAVIRRQTETTLGRKTEWPAVCNCAGLPNADNAALIVAAVNALPALLSELTRLRSRVNELEGAASAALPSVSDEDEYLALAAALGVDTRDKCTHGQALEDDCAECATLNPQASVSEIAGQQTGD